MNIPKKMPISNFVSVKEDKNGALKEISFKNEDTFNFAFDIADAIADREPDRRAMIHIAKRALLSQNFMAFPPGSLSHCRENNFRSIDEDHDDPFNSCNLASCYRQQEYKDCNRT